MKTNPRIQPSWVMRPLLIVLVASWTTTILVYVLLVFLLLHREFMPFWFKVIITMIFAALGVRFLRFSLKLTRNYRAGIPLHEFKS